MADHSSRVEAVGAVVHWPPTGPFLHRVRLSFCSRICRSVANPFSIATWRPTCRQSPCRATLHSPLKGNVQMHFANLSVLSNFALNLPFPSASHHRSTSSHPTPPQRSHHQSENRLVIRVTKGSWIFRNYKTRHESESWISLAKCKREPLAVSIRPFPGRGYRISLLFYFFKTHTRSVARYRQFGRDVRAKAALKTAWLITCTTGHSSNIPRPFRIPCPVWHSTTELAPTSTEAATFSLALAGNSSSHSSRMYLTSIGCSCICFTPPSLLSQHQPPLFLSKHSTQFPLLFQ